MSNKCSLCKNPTEDGVCTLCGLIQSDDFVACRTVCIPDEKAIENYDAYRRRMLTAWTFPEMKRKRAEKKPADGTGNKGEYRYAYKKAGHEKTDGGEYRYAYKKARPENHDGGEYRYAYKKTTNGNK